MPQQTYMVTAPDGRKVRLTGDAPPTDADLDEIFANLPPPSAPADPAKPAESSSLLGVIGDVATGAAKGVANTAIGLGQVFYDYVPGVAQASDAVQRLAAGGGEALPAGQLFNQARQEVAPTNTAQKVGYYGEQIGEFFTPTGIAGKAGKVAEVAKAGALTRAQTGSDAQAGTSAALSAVIPGAGAAKSVASRLGRSAEKNVAQALGATKEWAKSSAKDLAPEMLKRGVRGSRQQMLAQANAQTKAVGQQIGQEITAAAARGESIAAAPVLQAITNARSAVTVPNIIGRPSTIPGAEPVIQSLDKLEKFVTHLGADIPIDKAQHIKTAMDRIVSKAGLYGQKVGASATDSAKAWATREAAGAFRKLLAQGNADLAKLNQEYAFWKGLKSVLTETEKRTQAQGKGLSAVVLGAAGGAAGFASGETFTDRLKNAAVGAAGGKVVSLMQSPAWKTRVSAPAKQALADALASNSAGAISAAVRRIVASVPGQLKPIEAH